MVKNKVAASELCRKDWTARDAVWVVGWMVPRNHVLDVGPDHPVGEGNLGGRGRPL